MRLIPVSYNGYNINNKGQIVSSFLDPHMWSQSTSSVSTVNISSSFPKYGSKQLSAKSFSVNIYLLNSQSIERQNLSQYLNTSDLEQHQLIAFDTDYGRYWYLDCSCTNMVCSDPVGMQFIATFTAVYPIWRSENSHSIVHSVTETTHTFTVDNLGNYDTFLYVEAQVDSMSSKSFLYGKYITVSNNSSNALSTKYPLELTGAVSSITGWDTATLVTAGEMQASGNDLRTFVDGLEVDRWIADINTDHTKVWINWNNVAGKNGYSIVLGASIAATGDITSITIKNPSVTVKKKKINILDSFPEQGYLAIGTEQFYYTGKDSANGLFLNAKRAQRTTSMGAHSVDDAVLFFPNDITIMYGAPSLSAPEINDVYKPAFNLSTSTNKEWIYDTVFGSVDGLRTGSFAPSVNIITGPDCDYYTVTQNEDADPFSVMGSRIQSYIYQNKPKSGHATIWWKIDNPCLISSVTANGKTYKTSDWIAGGLCGLFYMVGSKWKSKWTQSGPGSASSWTAWSKSIVSFSPAVRTIAFQFHGSIKAMVNNLVAFEVSGVTLTLNASAVPTPSMSAGTFEGLSLLDMKLTNTTTGKYISLNRQIALDNTAVLDMENHSAYIKETLEPIISGVKKDANRGTWLPIIGGSNTITYEDTGNTGTTLTLKWYDRSN